MRRRDVRSALLLAPFLLAACATAARDLAPARSDRPWTPAIRADGEILPGAPPASAPRSDNAYILPSNRALARLPSPPPTLDLRHAYTLPELIDLAQSSNPLTRVAWDDARNAALAAGIVESAYLPNVSAGIVGAYQLGRNSNSVGGASVASDVTASGAIAAVSVQWLLFDFGERSALLAAAGEGSVISNIAFTAAHQRVIYNVSLAFYADAAARARLHTAVKSLRDAEAVAAAAEDRFRRGIGTVVALAQARQATAQARLAKVEAAGAAQDAYFALISAIGISPFTQIRIADLSHRTLSPALIGPIEDFVSAALARRPDMLGADAAEKASLADLRAARAEFLPKVFLSATGSYLSGGLAVTALPGVGQQASTVNLSGNHFGSTILMGVTIPLYSGGDRAALLAQARANVDKAGATLTSVRNEAIREIVKAENAVKTNLSAYAAAGALAAAAQTTFDASLVSYLHGVGPITDVTIAEAQLLQARDAETDAYSMALTAAASLALSAGTLGAAPR